MERSGLSGVKRSGEKDLLCNVKKFKICSKEKAIMPCTNEEQKKYAWKNQIWIAIIA